MRRKKNNEKSSILGVLRPVPRRGDRGQDAAEHRHGGTLGASDGLSADWDVANWHSWDTNPDGSCASALNWFSGRGNRQILSGYYDEGANISIGGWLDKAKGVPGVYAVMYTTWGSDYTQLANFAQAVRDWEAANP